MAEKSSLLNVVEITLFIAMVIWYSGYTYKRNNVWEDDISLWSYVANKSPSKARPHFVLGTSYNKEGLYDKGISELEKALAINTNDANIRLFQVDFGSTL